MQMPKKALIMYVPNLHRGYGQLVNAVQPDSILLLDESVIAMMVHKDPTPNKEREHLLRSFPHKWEAQLVKGFMDSMWSKRGFNSAVLYQQYVWSTIKTFKEEGCEVVLPYEDISTYFQQDYLDPHGIEATFSTDIFLRYNKQNAEQETFPVPGARLVLAIEDYDPKLVPIIQLAFAEADKSDDYWIQVGAVLFDETDCQVLLAGYNKHLPDGHHRWMFGDARSSFGRGHRTELVTAIHAEQGLFMEALDRQIPVRGKSLYVTTFPCPTCSNMIARSGIKKLYYTEGYSVMDEGRKIFESSGVDVIWLHPEAMKKAAT